MAWKNSAPTMRCTAGKASFRVSVKPITTLFLYTANRFGPGSPSGPTSPNGTGSAASSSAAAKLRCLSASGCMMVGLRFRDEHNRLGALRFLLERRPGGHVGIPLDQRGNRTDPSDGMGEETPDDFVDRAIMGIDEKRPPFIVGLPRMTCQVNLLHTGERISVDIGDRIPVLIGRRDVDIVDIEKGTASGALHDRSNEVDFRIGTLGEGKIG